jgi:hypothetical protein
VGFSKTGYNTSLVFWMAALLFQHPEIAALREGMAFAAARWPSSQAVLGTGWGVEYHEEAGNG